jgi:hypothetical protein
VLEATQAIACSRMLGFHLDGAGALGAATTAGVNRL